MKSMFRILLVPFVTLAFAGVVSAQGTSSSTAPAKSTASTKSSDTTKSSKAAAPKVQRARGELTSADAKAGTAKVKTKDKELSLTAESQEAKDSLAKVKAGDTVRVAYVDSDGKLTLRSISKSKLPTTTKSSSSNTATGTTKSSTASDTKPAK
jgi:hypothetical protein